MARFATSCSMPSTQHLARFWAAVLDDHAVTPYDQAELDRLRSIGVADTDDDPTVLVASPQSELRLWVQRASEPKVVKNRVHLDLVCDDVDLELTRLVALGARVADQANDKLVVLVDPQGNKFCLLR
jgi:hypothetical protein